MILNFKISDINNSKLLRTYKLIVFAYQYIYNEGYICGGNIPRNIENLKV